VAERLVMTQVTLLQPKASTTDADLATLFKAVRSLQKHIPCLLAVAAGENHSTQHKGFTHGVLLHFEDETHMREALLHEKYRSMQERMRKLCDQIVTFEVEESLPLTVIEQGAPAKPEPSAPAAKAKAKPATSLQREPPSPEVRSARSEEARKRQHLLEQMNSYRVQNVDARLMQIVRDQLGVDESEVVPSASLVEDLNADSLDLVEYIMSVEQMFSIQISDEDAEIITTVGETQAYLVARGSL